MSCYEIADLLEKHLGINPSETHCIQAINAVARIRDIPLRNSIQLTMLLVDGCPCNRVKELPAFLRSFAQVGRDAQPILPADAFGAAELKR